MQCLLACSYNTTKNSDVRETDRISVIVNILGLCRSKSSKLTVLINFEKSQSDNLVEGIDRDPDLLNLNVIVVQVQVVGQGSQTGKECFTNGKLCFAFL